MTDRIRLAQGEVLEAARCVVNSYRAAGGYTMPLSENLRRLATAQGELDAAVYVDHRHRLNAGRELSDNAGWDCSVLWPAAAKQPEATVVVEVMASPKATSTATVGAADYLARRRA